MQSNIRLIVNADDYGHSSGVSAGIRRAHLHGIVTTTTAMMCYDGVADDIRLAREQCPALGLGVHLMLTEGRPLRPAQRVPSLVNAAGAFYDIAIFAGAAGPQLFDQISVDELRDEWRAQIEAFLSTGAQIDHLDSHHHIAYSSEKTFAALLDLAGAYNVPLRVPTEVALDAPGHPLRFVHDSPYSWLVERAAQLPIRRPDGCVLSFYGQRASLAELSAILEQLPEGSFELMCHPGYVDDQLCMISSYNVERGLELALLVDPRVREIIERRGIELTTFAALA